MTGGSFLAEGVDAPALLSTSRYFKVVQPGTVGVLELSILDPKLKFKVVRVKPGAPKSIVVKLKDFKLTKTNYATVVLGRDPETGMWVLFTAHPGNPVAPGVLSDLLASQLEALEKPTLKNLQKMLGEHNQVLKYVKVEAPVKLKVAKQLKPDRAAHR